MADEGEEDGGIEGEIAVEVLGIGFGIAAVVGEVMLDGFFELDFAVVDHARASSCASWRRRSSWPVTAAEMRAARYSRRRAMAEVIFAVASDVVFRSASSRSTISACSAGGGNGKRYRRSFSAVRCPMVFRLVLLSNRPEDTAARMTWNARERALAS